ncbi:MAG: hypothetical protein Fur0041_13360 [Bacteroidia bacterium]
MWVVSPFIAGLAWSGWLTYPSLFILVLTELTFFSFIPREQRTDETGKIAGVLIVLGILCVVAIHWFDRTIAQQERYNKVSLREILNADENAFVQVQYDSVKFSAMIGDVRYNLDDNKNYEGEFLLPLLVKEDTTLLIWVYEMQHFGWKRKSDLLRDLRTDFPDDSVLTLSPAHPAFPWIDFSEAGPASQSLGYQQHVILKRTETGYDTENLKRIKCIIFMVFGGLSLMVALLAFRNKS